ncbi:hypothetical protein F4779DRAFT_561788 [Xylariaceae sp. FL0662B]|nr:hypothetical protein F4779DRAFT_561788 [Xylariaceae sp. FL0662B]
MNTHALSIGTLFGVVPQIPIPLVVHHNLSLPEPVILDNIVNVTTAAVFEEANAASRNITSAVMGLNADIISSITQIATTPNAVEENETVENISKPETMGILPTGEISNGTQAVHPATSAPTPSPALDRTSVSITSSMAFETNPLSLTAMVVTAPPQPQMTLPSSGNSTSQGVTSNRPREPEPIVISAYIPSSPRGAEYFRPRGWPTVVESQPTTTPVTTRP